MILKLLQGSSAVENDASAVQATSQHQDPPPANDLLNDLLGLLGNRNQEEQSVEHEEQSDDSSQKAMEVLKLLTDFKDSGMGELLLDKPELKVYCLTIGNNLRYSINKDLQVDCGVFSQNGEIYMHLRKKFPKADAKSNLISFKIGLVPGLLFVANDAAKKLQNTASGRDIDPKYVALAQKIVGITKK